jgi:hypothetical protein
MAAAGDWDMAVAGGGDWDGAAAGEWTTTEWTTTSGADGSWQMEGSWDGTTAGADAAWAMEGDAAWDGTAADAAWAMEGGVTTEWSSTSTSGEWQTQEWSSEGEWTSEGDWSKEGEWQMEGQKMEMMSAYDLYYKFTVAGTHMNFDQFV